MAIKKISKSDIHAYLEQRLEQERRKLVYRYAAVAEECLSLARSTTKASKNFLDQTGNLRSSMGYIIVDNGRVINFSDFKQVKEGDTGTVRGKALARQLADRFGKGICMVFVAGMEYAVFVENRGYDVLTSANLQAETDIPDLLKELGYKISKL